MDDQSHLESFYARVEQLEKQNRWMKRAFITVLLFVAATVVTGQAVTNKVITANEFRLVNSSGKVRGLLQMEDGRPTLSLTDAGGFAQVSLNAFDGGAGLLLGSSDHRQT